jgi:hypothetical protein
MICFCTRYVKRNLEDECAGNSLYPQEDPYLLERFFADLLIGMVAGVASACRLLWLAMPLTVVRAGHAREEMKIDLQAIDLESQKNGDRTHLRLRCRLGRQRLDHEWLYQNDSRTIHM